MMKKAISVTFRPENLLWVRGAAHALSRPGVSGALHAFITSAPAGARGRSGTVKSIVGSIQITASDRGLMEADAVIRGLFPVSGASRRPRRLGVRRRAKRA